MDVPTELTDIQRFYKNSTVFLTGATGFIGKLVLEKILRSLPVKKVFILVREKKGVVADQRVGKIIESPVFDQLKRTQPDALQKISLMLGDCSLPMLGLSQEDQSTFIEEVNVVFHVAATVRFDELLKKATLTNVRGTRDLILLAQKIKNLKTFVYVGSAFSNSNRTEIKEQVYPAKIEAEKLITMCEILDDECINAVTETLTKTWPNTYTFSKQVTEDYINRKARNIPICIVRPSIVVSTFSEPVAAFVDNVYTLAGFVSGNALGLTRISYYKNTTTDIVPADFVVNQCIAAGWQTGELFKPFKTEVPVYNISSGVDNPITQDQLYDTCDYYARQVPTEKMLLFPLYFRTTCRYNYFFLRILFHTLAAYVLDFVTKLKGGKPMFVDAVEKLHKFQESYEYFATHNFFFHVENTHKILRKMTFRDRELFNFDVTTINWDTYLSQYIKGLRFYLFGDPIHTVPEGKKHYNYLRRLWIIFLVIAITLLYVTGKIFLFRILPALYAGVLYVMRGTFCNT